MDRLADEADYVLVNLRPMRAEVAANPELFDPDGLERIDEAIAHILDVRPKKIETKGNTQERTETNKLSTRASSIEQQLIQQKVNAAHSSEVSAASGAL